jgi:hypothetical protein
VNRFPMMYDDRLLSSFVMMLLFHAFAFDSYVLYLGKTPSPVQT